MYLRWCLRIRFHFPLKLFSSLESLHKKGSFSIQVCIPKRIMKNRSQTLWKCTQRSAEIKLSVIQDSLQKHSLSASYRNFGRNNLTDRSYIVQQSPLCICLETLFNCLRINSHPENMGNICILHQKPHEPYYTHALDDVITFHFFPPWRLYMIWQITNIKNNANMSNY